MWRIFCKKERTRGIERLRKSVTKHKFVFLWRKSVLYTHHKTFNRNLHAKDNKKGAHLKFSVEYFRNNSWEFDAEMQCPNSLYSCCGGQEKHFICPQRVLRALRKQRHAISAGTLRHGERGQWGAAAIDGVHMRRENEIL